MDYATAVCLAYEYDPRFRRQQVLKGRTLTPRRIRPRSTGRISETNRDIFAELEMDVMNPEEDEDEFQWKETLIALEENKKAQAEINDTRRLVKVENIADDVTEEDLLELFRGTSEKLKAHIAMTSDGKRRGYGFVLFGNLEDAVVATRKVDKTLLKGEEIACRWMGHRKHRTRGLGMGGKKLFKGEHVGRWVEHVKTGDI
jgi:hypothetical protein